MSYEQECNDYALYGDPIRDAYDYELMAEYDRWDGHRGDLQGLEFDVDPVCEDDPGYVSDEAFEDFVDDSGWEDIPF